MFRQRDDGLEQTVQITTSQNGTQCAQLLCYGHGRLEENEKGLSAFAFSPVFHDSFMTV
ncbi:Unknown protein sequence [Pseudomonas syringae pv. aceris]|nr:Unknown protein sequence [Pseudomonas syringae pv. aceris]